MSNRSTVGFYRRLEQASWVMDVLIKVALVGWLAAYFASDYGLVSEPPLGIAVAGLCILVVFETERRNPWSGVRR